MFRIMLLLTEGEVVAMRAMLGLLPDTLDGDAQVAYFKLVDHLDACISELPGERE